MSVISAVRLSSTEIRLCTNTYALIVRRSVLIRCETVESHQKTRRSFCVPRKRRSSTMVVKPFEEIPQNTRKQSGKGRRRNIIRFPVENQCRRPLVNSAAPIGRIYFSSTLYSESRCSPSIGITP